MIFYKNLAHQWTNTFHGCLWFSTRAICWNRRTKYAHQFKLLLTYAAIFKNYLSLSMQLLPRMNIMLDFFCIGPVEQPEAGNKRKLQNEKFLSSAGFEPTPGVTLNSDPVEKWLPGSFFNVKSDSPGHFSTLKADTVQFLTLNFEPQVVKKWLPPWNFDFQGVIF